MLDEVIKIEGARTNNIVVACNVVVNSKYVVNFKLNSMFL